MQEQIECLEVKIAELKDINEILENELDEERKEAQYQKYKYKQGIRHLTMHMDASKVTEKTIFLE